MRAFSGSSSSDDEARPEEAAQSPPLRGRRRRGAKGVRAKITASMVENARRARLMLR